MAYYTKHAVYCNTLWIALFRCKIFFSFFTDYAQQISAKCDKMREYDHYPMFYLTVSSNNLCDIHICVSIVL